ncbi:MAG: chemotaxis protein CheD [Firmicutes bacterium]|nr:chemotaxis protein CheD [Bacillota bacterium]
MELIVGIGEYAVTNAAATIKTFALATCVAVTVYSSRRKAAGMVHIALPAPPDDLQKKRRPAYYAATGIPLLIGEMQTKFGCTKNELIVNLYGGAISSHAHDTFNIGKKNIDMSKQILADLQLPIEKEDVGGRVSRTVSLDVSTGLVKIYTQPLII